jgi:tRNA threonylcarbamoyladenosine biosynthesis protein TsaE
MMSVRSHSREETIEAGRKYGLTVRPGDVVGLFGDLGTGKTHFVAGVCRALGVKSHISSPTFTLINEYAANGCIVAHVDLYRIESDRELQSLGLEEYFTDRFVCLVEWAEKMEEVMPDGFRPVRLSYGTEENVRVIQFGLHHDQMIDSGSGS